MNTKLTLFVRGLMKDRLQVLSNALSLSRRRPENVHLLTFIMRQPILTLNLFAIWLNLTFPKAGFYLGSVPVNFGYIILGIGSMLIVLQGLFLRHLMNRLELVACILLIGNACFQLVYIVFLGSSVDLSLLFGHIMSTAVLPILTLISVGYVLRAKTRKKVLKLMLFSLFTVSVFGLFHFIALNVFKKALGVPFVTFTGADFDIYGKSIDRGGVFKLVSTYNNGNIFGVNILLWSNLALFGYLRFSRPRVKFGINVLHTLVQVSLLLTLSRTVWLILVCNEIFLRFFVFRKLNKILGIFLVLLLLSFLVFGAARLFVQDPVRFLFDSNLGARRDQLEVAWMFWPDQAFKGTTEIVYASMLNNFGLIGFFVFLVTWTWPLFIPPRNFEGRLVQLGLFAYTLAMGADGAFIYVPTQVTYWLVVAFALNPDFASKELK